MSYQNKDIKVYLGGEQDIDLGHVGATGQFFFKSAFLLLIITKVKLLIHHGRVTLGISTDFKIGFVLSKNSPIIIMSLMLKMCHSSDGLHESAATLNAGLHLEAS